MFYKDERIAVFIDGKSLFSCSKGLGFDIDFKLMRQEFARRGKLTKLSYFTTIVENDEFSSVKPLVDWLSYNGYNTIAKPAKEFTDPSGRRKVKGNTIVEMAVAVLDIVPYVDHIVIVSGDGDLKPLVESVQRRGVRVSVVSSIRVQPAMLADDLRRQADNFIELDDLRATIGKPLNVAADTQKIDEAIFAPKKTGQPIGPNTETAHAQ
jgi:uncharacterized LabA/DUF88 family protein